VSSVTNVSCYGGNNGSATASVSGGTGPFSFLWSSGSTSATATGLTAGSYTVVVTSANGCTVSASTPFIGQPTKVLISISTFSLACFGTNNGSAVASVFGGTGAYSYTWQTGTVNGATVSALPAGIYSMQVADANNCAETATFAITQPAAALGIVLSTNSVSCFGGLNGTAFANASGGTAPYNYNWTPFGGSAALADSLGAGNYTVNVTDVNGCATTGSISVVQPAFALTATVLVDHVNCFGGTDGSATVSPLGGMPGYSYTWSPSGGNNATANNLQAGNYIINIADINNCSAQALVNITEPPVLTGTLDTLDITDPSCNRANGSLLSQISGGSGPYAYLWLPGSLTSPHATSLVAGSYTLQVTDAQNCGLSITATLTDIPGPSVTVDGVTNVSCANGNNGSATISISQGTGPFTISWLPFGGNALNGVNLVAGTYTAFVVDALGCDRSATVVVTEPSPLAVSVGTLKNVSCFGLQDASVTVVASGGTPGYTFTWSPPATGSTLSNLAKGEYTVSAIDANNCLQQLQINVTEPAVLTSVVGNIKNALCFSGTGSATLNVAGGTAPYSFTWSSDPPQGGNELLNVPAGDYSVTVTDAHGCTQINTLTITAPAQIITSVTSLDTVCAGKPASLVASATGGNGNYYYSWMPAGITNSGTLNFTPTTTVSHTVLAFDQNGCSGIEATRVVYTYDLNASNLQLSGYTPICPGATTSIESIVSGRTGPITYSWSHGLGTQPGSVVVAPAKNTIYTLTITNACGKSVTDTVAVLISPPPVVRLAADSAFTCIPGIINFQDRSGTANSADPVISWEWDFGDGEFSAEQHPAHTYTSEGVFNVNLTVTTDRGCTDKSAAPVIVRTFPPPVAAFSVNAQSFDLPYEELQAINQSSDAVNYFWQFGPDGTSNLTNPKFMLKTVGTITIMLVATSQHGCKDTAFTTVETSADVVFPNAFTPNESGASGGYYNITALNNDIFFPYTSGVVEFNLQIFNRWGELIFESNDIKQGWDGYYRGKLCQLGVYVWKAKVKLTNGKQFNKAGNVTLLR
jgi:gliding motility-associated-like protein